MADNINQQLQQEGALPTLNPMVPSSGKFEFQPISDFTVSPDLPEYSELMSPEYKAMLDIHAKKINSAIPRPVGNMNDPNPTLSTSTYNPYRQSVGLDLSTPEGKLQLLSNTGKFTKPTGEVKIANPIYAGIRSHNFDRYYKHPEFSKLGWHPYADNEEYYNANSTWWDDASRMRVQFANLAGTGFLSAYRSIGDLFDSDDYFTGKDLESASEFADAMRIGNSTRGGVSGFTNNLALQFGYTAGVIGSIAAEELALWGAAAAQGFLNPVSDVVAAERTAFNIAKLGKTILNTFDLSRLANATRNMYRGLRSVDGAKDLYNTVKAGGNFLGNIIAPETVQAIKTLNSTANGAQNLSNMAKVSKTFGGFYRDVRSLNLALAESKMEGGTVYSQQLANGYALQSQLNNGSPITTDQMQNIEEKASRAAYYTTLLNAPTIYLSNQLVLGNAFGAYNRTLSRMLGDNIQGIGGRILKTKGLRDAAGKVVTRPFEYVGDGVKGYLKTLKAAGIKGSAKLAGQASLRYFAANLSEGLQEITQEAIAEGTKHYHQTLIEHPTAGGHDLMSASIASAVGSQFSAQGFETFMSGFLMGGIAQGPQKLFFQGVPSIYNYGALGFGTEKQKANLVEYKENKEKLIKGLVDSLNDVYEVTANNPMESIFDTNKINHIIQSQASIDMLQAAFDQSNFDFVDAKDFSKFQAIYTVLNNNKSGEFRQQFEDYLKLTDVELIEAFPSFKADIKSGKIRTRLQDMITKVDQLEESYYTNKSKFNNPFDPNIYKYGSREWNEEKIKQMSFEHARYLYMFTEDGFKRALERSQSIYDELAADPIVGKMAASDITVLLDENSLQKEIATLLSEIGTLDPKEAKDIIEAKTAKLEGLSGILSVLYAEENLTKDGGFNRRKIGKLTSAFEKYVQKLAKSNGTFADLDKVSNALKKIVDYRELKGRAIAYNKSIEYMNNPERFNEITQRSYDFFKNIYKNRVEVFRNSIKKYIGKIEINQFLNELAKIEVYPDPEQVKEFMENGNIDVLQDFFTEKGIVNPISDKDIYTQIQALILIYKSAVESKVTKDSTKEETKTKQNEKINFDDIDVQEIPEDIQAELKQSPDANILYKDQSPFAQKLLLNLYSEYKLREFAKGNSYLSLSEWVNGSQGASAVKSLEKVKKFWHISLKASSLSAQEIDVAYKNDQGFQEWILTQKEEPMIYRALMLGGLSFENIEMNTTGVGLDSVAEDNPNLRWIQKGPGINILERRVGDPTSEEYQTILYTLTDNNGKQLSDEQLKSAGLTSANFSSITKATEAYKKALQKAPVDATYLFDGVDLKYLDEVENAQGDKFIVLGTSVSTNKGTKLKLLRFEDRGLIDQEKEAASFFVNEDGFSDLYTKVIESFEGVKFTENMSKLDPKDMSAVYARRFGEETSDVAASRFTRVLSILTPEELGKAQIVIFRNNRKEPKKLQYGITPENTFVNVNGDKYQIEIVLDPISTEKVRQALADTEYAYPEDFTGSIGFIANDQFSFTGVKGKEVNITSIDDAKIERYIISENSTAADLKNAALQQTYFIGKVDSLIDNSESKILTMSEFLNETGFDLKLTNGKFDQGGSPVSLEELDYNTFDGNMIVMINTKQKSGGVGLSYVTNLEGQAELDFINSVQKQLQDQAVSGGQSNLFNEARTLGRYVAIIKSPNGAITLAQLKQAPFSAEQRTELYRELLEKAQDVAAGKVEKKDLYAWNDNFKDKFYIPINPNLSPAFLDLKIDLKGNIILRVKVGKSAPTAFISQVSIPAEQLATFMENPTSVGSLFSNLTNSIEVQNFNASSPYKLKFSEESLLQVFPLNASLEEIVSKTKTDLDKRVRFGQRAYLTTNADIVNGEGLVSNSVDDTTSDEYTESVETPITAGVFTPTELFTDAEGNIIPKGPEITTSTESQTQPITSNQSDIEAKKAEEKLKQIWNSIGNGSGRNALEEGWAESFGYLDETLSVGGQNYQAHGMGKSGFAYAIRDLFELLNKGIDPNRGGGQLYTGPLAISEENKAAASAIGTAGGTAYTDGAFVLVAKKGVVGIKSINDIGGILVNHGLTDINPEILTELRKAFPNLVIESYKNAKGLVEQLNKRAEQTTPTTPISDKKADKKANVEVISQEEIINSEQTLDQEIEEAKNNLEKEKALIEAEWSRTKRNRRILKTESTSYQAALEKLRILEKKRNDLNAFKILDFGVSVGEEYSLESFVAWANENLPDFIAIRDIKDIQSRIKAQGIPVGQFTMALKQLAGKLSVDGTIYTGPASSYRYHEAFHAVYRLLLTNQEQIKLRRLAKDEVRNIFKSKEAFDTELSRFRNLHPKYRAMSASELEKEYLEEYMADEFEKFKTNPRSTKTNSVIKSFFNRLLEWIKAILKGYKGNELTNLFEAIDAGKYKGGVVQDNIFVRSLFDGVTIDAYKIIPYEVVSGERMTSAKYLDPSTANMLIRMIGQTYVSRRETSELSDRVLLETVIDDYADLYNPEQEKYNEKSEKDFEKLENIYDALTMDEGSAVAEAVEQYLDLVNIKIENQDDEADQIEDEVGSRRVGDYNKDASQFGGFASATRNIRMFIAGVSIDSKDMFGNTELVDGEKIKIPVNHIDVYNGLMLAAMNKTNAADILKSMYIFSRRNENSGAVVDEFFRRTGVDAETLLETGELPTKVKDSKLFNEFLTTFTNSRVDYIFHFENENNSSDVSIFSASNRDAANSQIDYWKTFFNDKFEIFRINQQKLNEAINVANNLDKLLNKKTITNKELSAQANIISKELFEAIGIKLSPLYLEISIASSLSEAKTKYQDSLVSLGANKRLLTSEDSNILVQKLSASDIIVEGKKKTTVAKPENLFIDDAGIGMSSRLKSIALGNALFDENVGNTVFQNPNGDLVYAHQKQTYHLKRINELNEADTIAQLMDKFETNALLTNPGFIKMSMDNQLNIIRLAGLNAGKTKTAQEASELEEFTPSLGQTYGDFKSVDFIRTLINLYTADYNTKSNKNNLIIAEDKVYATAPLLIRIMESSNTGDMISLPIIKAVFNGQITDEALNAFVNIVEKEYNIIKENFKQGLGDIINYNDTEKGNGFKFFKAQNLLPAELQIELIEAAKNDKDWSSVSAEISTNIENVLLDQIKEFIEIVQYNKINVSSLIKGDFPKSEAADKAMVELNLERNNLEDNLAQIFLNNWINTLAINELILGEEARLFKDAVVDPIKRGKMQNAAHDSVAFDVLPEEALGIEHTLGDESIALMTIEDPKFEQRFTDGAVPGNKKGDKADAQTYITSKGARYFTYGLGELNSVFAEMLDKIDRGDEITSKDWFGKYQKANAYLNSKKFVYGDGSTFLKTSTVVLTKEETSNKVNGVWQPKVGMEELHYMRENMEAFEKENEGKIAIIAPKTAVKMLKRNIIATERIASAKNNIEQSEVTLLNAKDFGRQLINPSNKLEITEPTQIKSLITSEQYEGDDFKVIIDNQELSMKDVIAEYHKMVSAGVRFDYTQKRNLIFDLLPYIETDILDEVERSGSIEPNLILFIRSAQANLKSSAASSNMVEFFKDENGKPKYELNNPITSSKFEQFFLAYFSKKVLSQKTAGMSLALKSDFGKSIIRRVYSLDNNGNIDKQEVIRRKNFEKSGESVSIDIRSEDGIEQLKKALANNPEGVLVIDRLRINMPDYQKPSADPKTWVKTNVRYAETIIPAHYKEVMDMIENSNVPIPDVIAKMFIVRIPSQDKHSSMAVRLVDFDPVFNGSTAVFPEELIEISGADFDIDKVYASIKEWYVKNGKFIEYGTRKGEEGFEDYIHYVNKKVKVKGSYLNDALLKFNETGLPSIVKALDFKETVELLDLGYSPEAIDALQVLNMPKTKLEYDKYIKKTGVTPYKAPITNKILDLKFALQGNTKLTESKTGVPISYQPADVEALKQEWSMLSEMFPFLKDLSKEEGISIDNLIGQYYTHKNVKENSSLIGSVVPPNVILNFLKEQKVSLRKEFGSFQIDGINYNNLVDNESGLKELRRAQYIISNLISAATDDAKERLLTKLGYVKKAIKAVETMVAFGIPLHTATMLINVRELREILPSDTFNADLKLMISNLINRKVQPRPVTTDGIAKAVADGIYASKENLLGILLLFNKVNTVVSFIDEMISIFRLNNGFGKDFSSLRDRQQNIDNLGLYVENDVFKEMKYRNFAMPMDVRSAFGVNTPSNKTTPHYIGEYLRINKEFNDLILPQIFLTQTDGFKELYEGVLAYTYIPSSERGSKLKSKIQKNILAYVTFKAYMKQLFESEAGAVVGGSLSNEFIYPSESNFNINKVITDLRAKYQDKDNYFLDYFLFNKPAIAADNNTGLNTIITNSFGKLSDNEKVRIQNGFQTLYGQRETRVDAMHILHYAMIKDGLQYDYGSILDAITPFGMEKYLQASENALKAFKGQKSFEEVFDASFNDLKIELFENYGQSTSHAKNLSALNLKAIKEDYSYNFLNEGASIVFIKNNDKQEIAFPRFFQIRSDFAGAIYYRLTAASLKNENVFSAISEKNIIADKVTYEKFIPKGSYKQTAIGFMFDNENFSRPTVDKLQTKTQTVLSFEDVFGKVIPDSFAEIDNFDAQTIAKLEAFNQVPRTATEKGIEIDGVNIAEAERPAGVEDAMSKLMAFANKGVEISSNAKGLAAALTNPTELAKSKGNLTQSYPVDFRGETYRDAEAAYQALKGTASKDEGPNSTYALMVDIIKAKLAQHPRLVSEITKQGGSSWILNSTHQPTNKNTVWETGGKNWFIKALNEAYLSQVEQPESTFTDIEIVEEQFDLDLEVSPIEDFYFEVTLGLIEVDAEKMKKGGIDISSLEGLKKTFKNTKFTTEEEFIEYIEKCYLNKK